MTNPFYVPSGNPANGSEGLSSLMRAEFQLVAAGFDVMPRITTTGLFDTVFAQLGNHTFTLPVTDGTLALFADVVAETTRATAAEGTLTTQVAGVAAGLFTAQGVITTETANRIAADTTEATTRAAADAAETSNRNIAIAVETARAASVEALFLNPTWHSVTRVVGTIYTNSLSYPITVMVTATVSSAGAGITMIVNGVSIAVFNTPAANQFCFNFQVPAGQTYRVIGTCTLNTWFELF